MQKQYGRAEVASWEEEQGNLARAELQAMEADKQARMAEQEEQVRCSIEASACHVHY